MLSIPLPRFIVNLRATLSRDANSTESAIQLKLSLLDSISPRHKKLLTWTVAVVLFYTVFGFLLLPPIVRVIAVKQLSKHFDRPVEIQKVALNPYMPSATIRGLLIQDKDGTPLVSWDELHMNLQLVSLFSHAWVFKEVSLSKPVRERASEQGLHAQFLGYSRQAVADHPLAID